MILQVIVQPPPNVDDVECDCGSECDESECECRKWGAACKESCGCHHPNGIQLKQRSVCDNPFNTIIPLFFGKALPRIRANADFTSFVERSLFEEKANLLNREDITTRMLEQRQEQLDGNLRRYAPLKNFVVPKKSARNRQARLDEFMRRAIGDGAEAREEMNYYSFCANKWARKDMSRHCWECESCMNASSRSSEWHCGPCGRCVYGREHGIACPNCGGRSRLEIARMKRERAQE